MTGISLTFFKSQYDSKPKQLDFTDFDKLSKFLYMLSDQPLKSKFDAPLISPSVFVNDSNAHEYPEAVKETAKNDPEPCYRRKNRNVTHWAGWAAVDVDDVEIEGDVQDYVKSLVGDWKYVCYSTASSRPDKVKFRIVFELDQHIPQEKIKHFWFALQSRLDDSGDKQCKDLSRMYYIPGTYQDAYNFIFSDDGEPIVVDKLLAQYPYAEKKASKNFMDRLPSNIQNAVIEHRKSQMDQSYYWTGYDDCPFWPQKLANEYRLITDAGWYAKMYAIMVAVASRAIYKKYPITSTQIADLCKQFDAENGNWYENRPLDVEADRAIEYAYRNN